MSDRDAIAMMGRCHDKLSQRADELVACAAAGDDVSELLAFFEKVTKRHFADEERSIFPRLDGRHAELVEQLTAEHRAHEALLTELHEAAAGSGDLVGLAETWRRELTAHALAEDDELLPLLEALPADVVATITAEMKARRGKGGDRRGTGGGRGGGGGGGGGRGR